jgi:hypothetical protein
VLAGFEGIEFPLEVRAARLPRLQRPSQRCDVWATGDRLDEPGLLVDVHLELVPQGFATGSAISLTSAQQIHRVLDHALHDVRLKQRRHLGRAARMLDSTPVVRSMNTAS